jgi:DNA-3-methyladenine glycosylase
VNAVTESEGDPAAVLIRALEPIDGIQLMQKRRAPGGNSIEPQDLCRGPGNVTKALGISLTDNRSDLTGSPLYIEDRGVGVGEIAWGPRIGINVGVEKPWRCWVIGNRAVSGSKSRNGHEPRRR